MIQRKATTKQTEAETTRSRCSTRTTLAGKPTMHSPRIAPNPQANSETKTAADTAGCRRARAQARAQAGKCTCTRTRGRRVSTRRRHYPELSSFSLALGIVHHTALFPLALRGLPCHWAQPINHSQTPAEASVFCSGQWEKYSSLFLPPRSSAGWLKSLSLKPNTTNPWADRESQSGEKERAPRRAGRSGSALPLTSAPGNANGPSHAPARGPRNRKPQITPADKRNLCHPADTGPALAAPSAVLRRPTPAQAPPAPAAPTPPAAPAGGPRASGPSRGEGDPSSPRRRPVASPHVMGPSRKGLPVFPLASPRGLGTSSPLAGCRHPPAASGPAPPSEGTAKPTAPDPLPGAGPEVRSSSGKASPLQTTKELIIKGGACGRHFKST